MQRNIISASGYLTCLFLGMLIHQKALSQVTWRRTFGGMGTDEARSVRQTTDGGYIAAGTTGSFGHGASDVYVLRLDEMGNPLWTHTYGGPGVDMGAACREVPDGFVVAGTTTSGWQGAYDMLLIRTDMAGEPLWERSYGTSDWDLCNAMDAIADGFVLGGISYGNGMPQGAALIVRTNLDGDTIWTRRLWGAYRMECNGIAFTSDHGVVVAGTTGTSVGPEDGFLAKFDANGTQEWISYFGGDEADVLKSVVETGGGGFVACGTSHSGSAVENIFLVGVDNSGQFQWSRAIGNTADAGGAEIRRRTGPGFVFTGYNTLNAGAKDMILTTVDESGYFQHGNNFGDGHPAEGYSIDATSDGGYVVAGWAEGFGPGLRAAYIVKTDSLGLTANLNVISYDDPLPVRDLRGDAGLVIYPQMVCAGGQLHVRVGDQDGISAVFTDLRGVAVFRSPPLSRSDNIIQVPRLAVGPYIVSLQGPCGFLSCAKVIVVD